MAMKRNVLTRRATLAGSLASVALIRFAVPIRAATLSPTPAQTEGPFYPVELPPDTDWDLLRLAGSDHQALGTVTYVSGRILDRSGRPVPGTRVEIWQCDAKGRYRHPGDARGPRDDGFQGFGRVVTGADGGYRFRTIRPVPYPGRTPHIHFAVLPPQAPRLVTQMYVAGEPLNERDFVLNKIPDGEARARLIVALEPSGKEPGALQGHFDIVL